MNVAYSKEVINHDWLFLISYISSVIHLTRLMKSMFAWSFAVHSFMHFQEWNFIFYLHSTFTSGGIPSCHMCIIQNCKAFVRKWLSVQFVKMSKAITIEMYTYLIVFIARMNLFTIVIAWKISKTFSILKVL